jgi:dehydrogenase/reductase SDR family protein 12
MDRAQAAKDEIVKETSSENVHILQVDVGELASVRECAKAIQARESKLDVLVCNAGVLLNEKKETSEGNEATFASHLLGGSYLLPQLLLPQLKAAKGRVIMITSGGMYNFKVPSWEYLTSTGGVKYNGMNAYAYAKRGQVVLTERMSRDEPEVMWVTAHPGWADTNAVDEAFGENKKYIQPLRDPWEGAEGVAWLLGADRSKLEEGALYLDRKTQPKHLAGPFFTQGWSTKNKPEEIDDFMNRLKEAAGL